MIAGNPGLDFFEQNPELQYKTEFQDLIEQFGPKQASKIAWAVYMVDHPDSNLHRIPLSERVDEVHKNYGIDVTEHEEFRAAFVQVAMPKETALYKIHIEKLDELTIYLETLDLTEKSDFDRYIKIMDKLPKMWDALEKVKTSMIDQQNKNKMFGGASRSARERR